jgi:hypothetical protein
MKKAAIAFVLSCCALFFTTNTASAGVFIYSNGEKIDVVMQLPDSLVLDEGHVNLGVMYDQFSLFWIPLWNYGETRFVLINDSEDYYYDLDEEDIQMIEAEFGIDIPEKARIGFWNKIGGKLVAIAIIVGIMLFRSRGGKEEDDEVEENEVEEDDLGTRHHPGA